MTALSAAPPSAEGSGANGRIWPAMMSAELPEGGHEQADGRRATVRRSPLRSRGHHPVRALVSSLQAEPARPGGDDGRTRPVAGPYDHYALGVAIRTGVREALEAVRPGGRPIMEGGRDIRQNSRRMVLSLSCRGSGGRTVDFRLSSKRDVAAAKAFFRKAIKGHGAPRTITLDGYAASHRAVRELKADGLLPAETKLRSSKYLNNLIEQDHRGVKQRIATMLGFKGFATAAITIADIE